MSCTVGQCRQVLYAKGFCLAHYMQVYRGGTPGPIRKRNDNPPASCTVKECDRPYKARGMCMMHYQRSRRAHNLN